MFNQRKPHTQTRYTQYKKQKLIIMEIIFILIGLILGGLIAFLWTLNNKKLKDKIHTIKNEKSELKVKKEGLENENKLKEEIIVKTTQLLDDKTLDYITLNKQLATELANNNALREKLETQKQEIENLGKKFNIEFQNIANKILEEKTEKFSQKDRCSYLIK